PLARPRPALVLAGGRRRPVGGCAVRPLLRAGRARPPRDARPGLQRHDADARARCRDDVGVAHDPRRARVRGGDRHDGMAGAPVTAALEVRSLAFAYPDGHQALFGVDFAIGRGERVALLGPNGAGKTTLVLHLNGILTGGTGTVRVAGLPVDKRHMAEIRRRVGIVFQDPDDQLFMPTVREDVAFGPAASGLKGPELEARVDRPLARVGMAEFKDRPPHHLSFGQRRRVAVATVLAMEPEILVLDEPSSNLDPASRRELADILGASI